MNKYYENLQNEELIEFFLTDLKTLSEITAYVYPNHLYDDHSEIDAHIIRCQHILQSYIFSELSEFNDEITVDEIDVLATEKAREIFKLCNKEIEALFETGVGKVVYLGENK
jgi:hypothetical protein